MMLCRRGVLCRLVVQLLLVHAWTLNVSASEHREELRVLVMSENRQPDIIAAEETESALLDQGVTEVRLKHMEVESNYWPFFQWIVSMEPMWTLTVPPGAQVNVTEVRRLIRTEAKPDFMGYGITDPPDGLVIHHFDLRNISYPLASGGFLISPAISRQIKTLLPTLNDTDYVLDAYYSLADFVKHGIRRAATNSTSHALPEPPPSEPMHAWPKFDNYCVATDGQPLPWINVPVHVDDVNECQWACIAFDDCSAVMWFESGWDGSQCKLVLGADREHTEYYPPAVRGETETDRVEDAECYIRPLLVCHEFEWRVYPKTVQQCQDDGATYVYFAGGGCGTDNGCTCCRRVSFVQFPTASKCYLAAHQHDDLVVTLRNVSTMACHVMCAARLEMCYSCSYDPIEHLCKLYAGVPLPVANLLEKTNTRCYYMADTIEWPRYAAQCTNTLLAAGEILSSDPQLPVIMDRPSGDRSDLDCLAECDSVSSVCSAIEWYEYPYKGSRCKLFVSTNPNYAATHGDPGSRVGGGMCYVRPRPRGYTLTHISHWLTDVVRIHRRNVALSAPPRLRVGGERLLVAVKTTRKYHQSRVLDVLEKTWARDPRLDLYYFTDSDDLPLPNVVNLDVNVERGYCIKMHAIFTYLAQKYVPLAPRFILISDDDTLYNVDALLALLDSSYDPRDALYLGEKYFHGSRNLLSGLEYITTGGGLVISTMTLERFEQSPECVCNDPDYPDDWQIGLWAITQLMIRAAHHSGFHQRRPADYAWSVIARETAEHWPHISFHNIFGVRTWWPAADPTTDKEWEAIWHFLIDTNTTCSNTTVMVGANGIVS